MVQHTIYGRKAEDGSTQPLREHLLGAGELAKSFEPEYQDIAYAAAVLHDIGKASDDFQQYLLQDQGNRGSVRHAIHGALYAQHFNANRDPERVLTSAILALAIARHHGELPDCIFSHPDQAGAYTIAEVFAGTIPQDVQQNFRQVCERLDALDIDFPQILHDAVQSITEFNGALNRYVVKRNLPDKAQNAQTAHFFFGLFLKYVYSRLVDADRLDAAAFTMPKDQHLQYHESEQLDWDYYIEKLAAFTNQFNTDTALNSVRTSIYQQCQDAAMRETGIYQLAVPTGGGKTLASMNFALHHAKQQRKRRIIYVIPYLSITTQTAQVFRSVFDLPLDNNVLLEHYSSAHSYKQPPDNEEEQSNSAEESLLEKLAAERWDSPFIVTTMVQFLETVMSAQGTKLRKFHNMADSIIIFDEIQALPTNTINLFNEIVSFLANILHTTVVLCSATQPHLDQTERHNLALSANPDLVRISEAEQQTFRRTQIIAQSKPIALEEFAEHVLESAREYGNCLAVMNLKNEAKKVFQTLRELHADDEFTLVHLSTNMCNEHRRAVLESMTAQLASTDHHVICVSTQLIEAGVDISFRSVVRATAGLDSIIQAAGRCNRNGENAALAPVYVYSVQDEDQKLATLPTIRRGKRLTEQLLREYPDIDLLSTEAMNTYYNLLFIDLRASVGDYSIMDYELKSAKLNMSTEPTLRYAYPALGFNYAQRGAYRNDTGKQYAFPFAQAFATVGERFHVIDNAGQSVVVPYTAHGESSCKPLELIELLDQLSDDMSDEAYAKRLEIIRQLQPYTITLFDGEIKRLEDEHAIATQEVMPHSNFTIRYLSSDHYDQDLGVVYEIQDNMLSY